MEEFIIIDAVSDLHGHFPILEGGDLLIVAGDLTARDTELEYLRLFEWLVKQKYKKIIFISGNHDNWIQKNKESYDKGKVVYLCDSGTEFEGLKIWGSPWTQTFEGMNPNAKAFTVDTEEELAVKFSLIPDDTDILITHSPPYDCDLDQDRSGNMLGSISLRDKLDKLDLKIHVFGHIHEGYGIGNTFIFSEVPTDYDYFHPPVLSEEELDLLSKNGKIKKGIISVNASYVNEYYEPVNKPIRIVL